MIAVFFAVSITDLDPYEYFSERVSQQGQLWWRIYDLYGGNIHPDEFVNEINAFFEGDKPNQECIGAKNGIYKVMYLCAPETVVTNKLSTGSRYIQADYAVVYYYFGVLGVIIYSVLMAIIVSRIVNLFILALKKKEFIKTLIYLRFFNMIRSSFCMLTFGEFLDIISILSYVYLIFTYGRRLKLGSHRNMKSQVENGEINVKQQY